MDTSKRREKNSESMKIHLSESLKRDLKVLAAIQGKELSEYVRDVLETHTYGVVSKIAPLLQDGRRDEAR